MTYNVALSQGGWVIQVFSCDGYIGNISDLGNNISRVESLAFFNESSAMDHIMTSVLGM